MKRWIKIAALLAAIVIVLCSCGAAKQIATRDAGARDEGYYLETPSPSGMPAAADSKNSLVSDYDYKGFSDDREGNSSASLTTLSRDNTKVIHTANFSLQTVEFETSCSYIRTLAAEKGGYLESESVSNNSMWGSSTRYRNASFTVRVPAASYEAFLSGVNENCHVVSLQQQLEDVGAQYFDIEQKLETLNNKHDRLEALLREASDMSDIITIENALSDTEYEINHYKSNLNRYDSLINYSTVYISLQEVERPDTSITETPGFFERLGRSFSEGFATFTDGLSDFAMWLSYNILTIIVIVIIVVVIIKIHPIRRIKAGASGKKSGKVKPAKETLVSGADEDQTAE